MLKDYFKFAFGAILHRRLRSWLTLIGIFIGISAVVALISLGQGFKQAIGREFEKIGTDKLFITAKNSFGPPGTNAVIELTKDDLRIVKNTNGIVNAAGYVMANARVERNDNIGFFTLHSIPEGEGKKILSETQTLIIKRGRELTDSDSFSVVLGSEFIDKELLGRDLNLRNSIKINGREFVIVGFYDKTGDPVADKTIFMPEKTLRDVFNIAQRVDVIIVKIANVENINTIAEKIENSLRRFRKVKIDEEDFEVQTPDQILGSFNQILDVVQAVLIGIAGISLVVGGVGIANTMYTAVLERTKDIGIMKSIGARNMDILLIFLFESGTLGVIGGFIGVIAGFSLSKAVEFIAVNVIGTRLIEAYFSFTLFFGALAFSFLIGVIFGVLPARQASMLQPVEALRGK